MPALPAVGTLALALILFVSGRPSADSQLTREGLAKEPAALRGGYLDCRTVEPVAPAAERAAPATDPRALEVAQAGSEPAGAAGPVPQPGADP